MNIKDIIKCDHLKKEECRKMPERWGEIAWKSYSKYYEKAIKEEKPSFYTMMVGILYGIYVGNRDYIDQMEILVNQNMKESDILWLIGSALCAIGYHEEGISKLRSSIRIEPSLKNQFALMWELNTSDELGEKVELCQCLLKDNPDDYDALYGMSYVLLKQGKAEEAKPYVLKALQTAPKDYRIREAYAEYLFAIGDYKNAVREYEWVLKNSFQIPQLHLYQQIVVCYCQLENKKVAKKIALKMKEAILLRGPMSKETEGFFVHFGIDV